VDFLKTLTDESFKPVEPLELPSGMLPVHNTMARRDERQIGKAVK
jgi:cytochrome c peroxidase